MKDGKSSGKLVRACKKNKTMGKGQSKLSTVVDYWISFEKSSKELHGDDGLGSDAFSPNETFHVVLQTSYMCWELLADGRQLVSLTLLCTLLELEKIDSGSGRGYKRKTDSERTQ